MNFEQAWPLLVKAANIGDYVSKEETQEGLRSGAFQLFTRGNSAAITVSKGDTLRIGLGGGSLTELKGIHSEIRDYAKQNGFTQTEILGRSGWEKLLGYDRVAVLMRKKI